MGRSRNAPRKFAYSPEAKAAVIAQALRAAFHRRSAFDLRREQRARVRCFHFEVRDEKDKFERRGNGKALARLAMGYIEPSEFRGRSIVRMAFEFGAKPENLLAR